jgi:hypothetical protein
MAYLSIYYTYAWLRLDGTPYYIGKGSHNRAFDKRRKYRPSPDRILILKKNLTEEEAFKHEIYMISIFGRKDIGTGILRNRTNGGEGVKGHRHTEESKKLIGDAQRGPLNRNYGKPEAAKHIVGLRGENSPNWGRKRMPETRNKMSEVKLGEKNPMYGIKGKENHSSKLVRCGETGVIYFSAQEAQDKTGISRMNIGACCRGIRNKAGGHTWMFVLG